MTNYSNILLATDFSDPAREAADHALMLADVCGARLHLLHVVEEFSYWESFNLRHFPTPEVYEELSSNARLALEALLEEDDLGEIDVVVHVREGKPFVEIIRVAKELDVDLIVIGSHGQSGIAENLFGSTAEKVVRKAGCPVLVIRHSHHEFSMP